jgi:hypothetical protein
MSRIITTGGVRIRLGSFERMCFYLSTRILTMMLELQGIKRLLQKGEVKMVLNECGNFLPSKEFDTHLDTYSIVPHRQSIESVHHA